MVGAAGFEPTTLCL